MMNRLLKHVQIRCPRLPLFLLVPILILVGVTHAEPAEDTLTGVWTLKSTIRLSSTITEFHIKADGTLRAIRAARKEDGKLEPRLEFKGTWTREGKQIRFRSKQKGHKDIDLFEFKACDYSRKDNDLRFKQWIACGFITHYARQSSIRKAGERFEHMGQPVRAMGGILKQAPEDLPTREYPPEPSPMKFCAVKSTAKYPFHAMTCLNHIPRGTVLRVLGRREDESGKPDDWYLIEFKDRFMTPELPKPFTRTQVGWVNYDLSRAPAPTKDAKTTKPTGSKRPAFDAKSPVLGTWEKYRETKDDQAGTLVIRPDFTYTVNMVGSADYNAQKYTAKWKYNGRNVVLMKPADSEQPMASILSGECVYKLRKNNLYYGVWLDCSVIQKFVRASSRVPPGAKKTIKGILDVVTIHGKTRPAPAGLEPRGVVLGDAMHLCYLDRKSPPPGAIGKVICGKTIREGTAIRVVARTIRKGAYPGWPGHAYLIEFNALIPNLRKTGAVVRDEFDANGFLFRALVGAKLE